jgi:hypothetical protein
VLGPDNVGLTIEIDKIACPDIHGARTETGYSGIQAIKVHQALQRVLKVFGVVETIAVPGLFESVGFPAGSE